MTINPFSSEFFLVDPLLNVLVWAYHYIPDIGVVIVLLTFLIRLVMAPSFAKTFKSQAAMNELQPKLNELREKYKNNKEELAKATMQLYKDNKINPFSSCLPLLLQFPILIALYHVFNKALNNHLSGLYSFVPKPEYLDPSFLGLINLSKAFWPLAVLAGLTQFWQSKMMMPKVQSQDATTKAMAMQTTYMLPLISAFVALKLPAGLPLYWVVTTIFAIGQQYWITSKNPKTP